jgi:hypothetical protein
MATDSDRREGQDECRKTILADVDLSVNVASG